MNIQLNTLIDQNLNKDILDSVKHILVSKEYKNIQVSDLTQIVLFWKKRAVEENSFIRYCLENDLRGAIFLANKTQLDTLLLITKFIYNILPSKCNGNIKSVTNWINND